MLHRYSSVLVKRRLGEGKQVGEGDDMPVVGRPLGRKAVSAVAIPLSLRQLESAFFSSGQHEPKASRTFHVLVQHLTSSPCVIQVDLATSR
jgi:hypothetical protein